MFLRNYDNIFILRNSPITLSDPSSSSVFGEGSLYLKNVGGGIQNPVPEGSLFTKFVSADNSNPSTSDTVGRTCSIRWSDSTEPVDYDEYTVNFPNTSTPVSVSTEYEYNEIDESYITTVKQIYVAKQPLTVGSIIVTIIPSYTQATAYPKGAKQVMLFREVLDAPIDVDTDGSFVLTFKMKRPANPNKPADYVATASVE